jgi:hypothetical protein
VKVYGSAITASINRKGVLDIDTVKGCELGMEKYPDSGCYGLCYAAKCSKFYGYDFGQSSRRSLYKNGAQLPMFNGVQSGTRKQIISVAKKHRLSWFRIGVNGDPCHDWELTFDVCSWLGWIKTPVIVTKHWIEIPESLLEKMASIGVVVNTSISALDTEQEIDHRLKQYNRVKDSGCKSFLRVVSCEFGKSEKAKQLNSIQKTLFYGKNTIDNPLRIPKTDSRVVEGLIKIKNVKDLNANGTISIFNERTYIGHCNKCPDQCGAI